MRLGKHGGHIWFPNVGLQGFAPNVLAHGHHAGSTGYQPVPSGNLPDGMAATLKEQNVFATTAISSISFGRLPNEDGLAAGSTLPENLNYAVKSSFLLSFLNRWQIPAKLKDANTKERKFEDVVRSAEHAAVLVLVY